MRTSHFLAGAALLGLALNLSCGAPPASSPGFKVVMVGVDGMDPDLVRDWRDQLPHLNALAQDGTFADLKTVAPPQCAVAWASFVTGLEPSEHGLSDSILRRNTGYQAIAGFGRLEPPWEVFGITWQGPTPLPAMRGTPFWKVLDDSGIASVNLRAPLALPLGTFKYARILAGLGVPDARQTWGTHYYLASDLSSWDLLGTNWAGVQIKLELQDGKAEAGIEGPPAGEGRASARVSLELNQDRSEVTIRVGDQEQTVAEGSWSDWFTFGFPGSSYRGAGRFYVLETFPELRLYLSPIGLDPADPAVSVSAPQGYSAELVRRHGRFKTQSESSEIWGLNQERIDEAVFLEDLHREFDYWRRAFLEELEVGDAAVYSLFLEAPDSAAHALYRMLDSNHPRFETRDAERYGDALLEVYRRVDSLVGEISQRLDARDVLLVVSDHGVHSWEKDFNVNAWLRDQGRLRLRDLEAKSEPNWEDLFAAGAPLDAIDWGKTEAYGVGLAGIYINLAGREPMGIVEPGEDYSGLVEEIRRQLMEYRDPDTGKLVVASVHINAGAPGDSGGRPQPDLIIGLREGYRASWETALGGTPDNVLVANLRKWSGDHATSAISETAGLVIINRPSAPEQPALVDIAPTLYQLLGINPPVNLDGAAWKIESRSAQN